MSRFLPIISNARGDAADAPWSYRDTLRLFLEFAAGKKKTAFDRMHLSDFDADLVLDFLDDLKNERHNSVSTRNCRLAALHSFFAHALRRHPDQAGRLARIPAVPPKRNSPTPAHYLDPPIVQVLLQKPNRQTVSDRRDYALFPFFSIKRGPG